MQTIGDHSGVTPQAIYKRVKKALERMVDEAVEHVRKLELLRCDELQVVPYQRALAGDDSAIDSVLAIMRRRTRLLGLDIVRVASEREQPAVMVEVVGDAERSEAERPARLIIAAQGASDPPSLG